MLETAFLIGGLFCILQAWVLAVVGASFGWFWTHGGQTLPMKTWRLRVLRQPGRLLLTIALAGTPFLLVDGLAAGVWARKKTQHRQTKR